ncbi:oligosaccharyl transferase subunit OST3/OST6 family [Pholiota conissans]|uniref:Oligosaccharyl transferase subunit OST3/OST6 family n=1 Tax=Pholiota conissans TaxID=109636 RepID=A0A9P5Z6Z7_9AGAR|nr:oligosaccharyl transferase subunit OST3/OST6 family [Pholiota conissans]
MKFLLFASLCSLLALPSSFAATPQEQLALLAAAGNGVIKLNTETYDLLTSPKRTWSASIQLTALDPRRRCGPCKEFNPAWHAVARAWHNVPAATKNEHFFAMLDFDEGPTVFQKLGIASAPIVFNYPAADGPRKPKNGNLSPVKYDFSEGFDATPLASFLSKYTPIDIPYKDPIDWMRWITISIAALGAALLLRFISPIVQNKWSWAVVTVITSLVMTSGYMFTRIRNVPFNGGNGNWIAAGYQNQFGQEVQVVSFIYGLLSFAFLMLILVVPLQSSPQRQRLQVYLWTGVIMIIYSVLISLFRVKNRGYPFKLFL